MHTNNNNIQQLLQIREDTMNNFNTIFIDNEKN